MEPARRPHRRPTSLTVRWRGTPGVTWSEVITPVIPLLRRMAAAGEASVPPDGSKAGTREEPDGDPGHRYDGPSD
jgi:hypothetical protein